VNRARARRRLLAWDRYAARYPDLKPIGRGGAARTWRHRAYRHRSTHAGVVAYREGRAR
jgi:hypothetical protein